MRSSLFMLAALGFMGCSGTSKDSSEDSANQCGVSVNKTVPADGSVDFYYRGYIEFDLSDADDTAKVTSDIPGTTAVSEDGKTITYTPTGPLDPNTTYTVTLTYCSGTVDLSFTTSALGTSLSDPSILDGKAYNLDLQTAHITKPAGVGAALGSLLTTPILVGVVSADASKLQMIGAIGLDGTTDQDVCKPSIPFPEADFTASPFFTIGPADTTISISGAAINVKQLQITGTFASDGSSFGGGTLSGSIDARDIAAALPDLGYDADGLCGLIQGFGAACGACPDGQNYCLDLVADSIEAAGTGSSLIEVTDTDIANNPSCAQ